MNRITTLSFPGLGIGEFQVNSVAFKIFGMNITWYALIIAFGMVCAVAYVVFRAKKIGISFDQIIDFAIFVIPIGVIGARLYYVIFNPSIIRNFGDIFNIRGGGLAIYGGIIAGGITVYCVCKFKKINFPAFGDCVVPGVILAQAIGRWGNFMNGEAYGYDTDIFCRMGILIDNTMKYVHPTFLYESLWNIIGFIAVNFYFKHKKYDGEIILLVFGWYGLGRMWIEGLRTDSLYIGIFRVSQLLAGAAFIVCLGLLIYFAVKPPKKELFHYTPKKKVEKSK